MDIPTKEDWGDLSDFDKADAFKEFFGRSNQDMQKEYKINIMARCSDFYEMPLNVFTYYVYGLVEFIESKNANDVFDIASAASCLFNAVSIKLKENQLVINKVMIDLFHVMKDIIDNQELYYIDKDIYGDFKEVYFDINENLKKLIP